MATTQYENLADRYVDAWNQHDVDALLDMMSAGAAYYDAFWRETCVGRELRDYFSDACEDEGFFYRRIGSVRHVGDAIVFRYAAFEDQASASGEPLFTGADVLRIHDNKILTVSDFYCNPLPEALDEVADLETQRHGVSRFVEAGLGEFRFRLLRRRVEHLMATEAVFLDPELTEAGLAQKVECSVEHLLQIIEAIAGKGFDDYIEALRLAYADRRIAAGLQPGEIDSLASEVGFDSRQAFVAAFQRAYGKALVEA